MKSIAWVIPEALGIGYAAVVAGWWERFRWFGAAGMCLCSFTMFETARCWRERSKPPLWRVIP